MKTAEYIDLCKEELSIRSDYKLAKIWELKDSDVCLYRSGKLKADNYLCFRIAKTLHKNACEVIIDLETQKNTNAVKSLFFKNYSCG